MPRPSRAAARVWWRSWRWRQLRLGGGAGGSGGGGCAGCDGCLVGDGGGCVSGYYLGRTGSEAAPGRVVQAPPSRDWQQSNFAFCNFAATRSLRRPRARRRARMDTLTTPSQIPATCSPCRWRLRPRNTTGRTCRERYRREEYRLRDERGFVSVAGDGSPAAAAEPPTIDRFSFEQGSINEDDVFFTKKAPHPRMVTSIRAGGICADLPAASSASSYSTVQSGLARSTSILSNRRSSVWEYSSSSLASS